MCSMSLKRWIKYTELTECTWSWVHLQIYHSVVYNLANARLCIPFGFSPVPWHLMSETMCYSFSISVASTTAPGLIKDFLNSCWIEQFYFCILWSSTVLNILERMQRNIFKNKQLESSSIIIHSCGSKTKCILKWVIRSFSMIVLLGCCLGLCIFFLRCFWAPFSQYWGDVRTASGFKLWCWETRHRPCSWGLPVARWGMPGTEHRTTVLAEAHSIQVHLHSLFPGAH